jgi:hypothetical protein
VLLLRSDRIGPLRALGWSLIAIVVLSPVVQPWYATWGFVFLAPIVEGRLRRGMVICSAIACFIGLPGSADFVSEVEAANPLVVGAASLILLGVVTLILLPRLRRHGRRAELRAEPA